MAAGLAAQRSASEWRRRTLKCKPFRETAAQLIGGIVGIVGVISVALSGQEHVRGMMDVIVPLCAVPAGTPVLPTLQISNGILVILQHKMNLAVCKLVSNGLRQLGENIATRIVRDGVNCVEPEAVEMIFLQPVLGVVDEIVADRPAAITVEINCLSPRSAVTLGKKLWRIQE